MKAISFLLLTITMQVFSQTPDSLNFFPAHAGDVWQYRSLFTSDLVGTNYVDSVKVDSISKNKIIHYRGGGKYRIDSIGNLYNLNFQSNYPRYKLFADSGNSWIAGVDTFSNGDTDRVFMISITRVYQALVFGIPTTIKVFQFDMIQFAGTDTFWLGNDHLAAGFGLVRQDVEPSDVYVLAGAIINGVKYGTIVSVEEDKSFPHAFDVLMNYPNPFNNSTVVSYSISYESNVDISIYDVLGRKIITLISEKQQKGSYKVSFNASNLPSGIYFAVMQTNSKPLIHKLLLIK